MTIISTITFSGKESACNARGAGDTGLTPGSGRSPGEEWRNNLRKNEEMEPKQKQCSDVDVTGDGSKV